MSATNANPLLTVVVPVYNVAPYLRKCLDSICGQTYRDLEIICVDDGSADESPDILEEYAKKDSRIRVLYQRHAKQATARNLALKYATGEYFTGVDADDYLDSKCYEKAMAAMVKGYDLVVFGAKLVNQNGEIIHDSYFDIKFAGAIETNEWTYRQINVLIWSKIFKRSLLDKYGIRFVDGRWYEDVAFCFMYLSIAQTVYGIQEALYYHLIRGDSTMGQTQQGSEQALDYLPVLDALFTFLRTKGLWKKNMPLIEHEVRHATTGHFSFIKDKENAKKAYVRWIRRWKFHKLFPDAPFLKPFVPTVKTADHRWLEHIYSIFYKRNETSLRISFLGIPLYKKTTKNGKVTTRIFGIRVFESSQADIG